jgi:hypothetical protein
MTDPRAAVTVLASTISIFLLALFFFWLYRDYRMDLFRQRLFSLRDELFDVAQAGALPFAHPAYGLLRMTLNGFIRFGGRLGMVTVLWLVWSRPDRWLGAAGHRGFVQRWDESSRELNAETKTKLEGIITRMHIAVIDHLVFTSLTLLLALVPLIALGLLEVGRQKFLTFIRNRKFWPGFRSRWIDPLDSAALTVGTAT